VIDSTIVSIVRCSLLLRCCRSLFVIRCWRWLVLIVVLIVNCWWVLFPVTITFFTCSTLRWWIRLITVLFSLLLVILTIYVILRSFYSSTVYLRYVTYGVTLPTTLRLFTYTYARLHTRSRLPTLHTFVARCRRCVLHLPHYVYVTVAFPFATVTFVCSALFTLRLVCVLRLIYVSPATHSDWWKRKGKERKKRRRRKKVLLVCWTGLTVCPLPRLFTEGVVPVIYGYLFVWTRLTTPVTITRLFSFCLILIVITHTHIFTIDLTVDLPTVTERYVVIYLVCVYLRSLPVALVTFPDTFHARLRSLLLRLKFSLPAFARSCGISGYGPPRVLLPRLLRLLRFLPPFPTPLMKEERRKEGPVPACHTSDWTHTVSTARKEKKTFVILLERGVSAS